MSSSSKDSASNSDPVNATMHQEFMERMMKKSIEEQSGKEALVNIFSIIASMYTYAKGTELGDPEFADSYKEYFGCNTHLVSPLGGETNPLLKAENQKRSNS